MVPVDDIIINKQMPQKKKGKSIIIILFFMLLIILAGLSGAYYWYVNFYETPKAAFFKYIVQTNIPEITDTQIFYNILEKANKESYETITTANFTTNKKTDFTENVDVSKFELTLDAKSNKEKKEAYVGANITYSSNDFFDVELINTQENIAIGSSEVIDKYLVSSKNTLSDSIRRTTTFETDVNADIVNTEIDKISSNRINFEDEYKRQLISDYSAFLMEKIPDEAVTLTEQSPITMNSEVVNTDAYALELDAENCKMITTEILNKLKNDKTLLDKIVTGEPTEEEVQEEIPTEPKPINITQIGGETEEHNTVQIIGNEEGEEGEPNLETELTNPITIAPVAVEPEEEENNVEIFNDFVNKEPSILVKIAGAILLNQKLEMTTEKLQSKIDEELQNLSIKDGIKITIYVKNVEGEPKETIKIVAVLPDATDLDIEYPEDNKIKITFLQDVQEVDDEGKDVTKNKGWALEAKRTNAEMQTKFNIIFNNIEEKKIVSKLQIDFTAKGSKTSKNYENDVIIKLNDNESDWKVNIKNKIDFKKPTIEQELNEENSIFLDTLTDEEATELYSNIILKLMDLYSKKILNMNFIDVNSIDGEVEQSDEPTEIPMRQLEPVEDEEESEGEEEQSSEGEQQEENQEQAQSEEGTEENQNPDEPLTKKAARDLLVAKIEAMMSEAEEYEEEFSILNLQVLPEELDGHPVSAEVNEDSAIVKVGEFTFHIDKDFMLTDQ